MRSVRAFRDRDSVNGGGFRSPLFFYGGFLSWSSGISFRGLPLFHNGA
jgi:hypothetical protein